jgi:ERCC4-related helicase
LTYIREGKIGERLYQRNIAAAAGEISTLVVLPTGLGKTVIALLVIDNVLSRSAGKILFMAPTKPLVEQHFNFLREKLTLAEGDIALMTGEIPASVRSELWKTSKIIVSTPQVVENDAVSGSCSLSGFSLLIYDECHRARGDYSYVRIARMYSSAGGGGLILGITASPGSDPSSVEEICNVLGIGHIEVRTEEDPDVEPYVQDTALRWIDIELSSELSALSMELRSMLSARIEKLKNLNVLPRESLGSTKDLLTAGREMSMKLSAGMKNRALFDSMRIQSEAIKIAHAIDLAETQTVYALRKFIDKLISEASGKTSKASSFIVSDEHFSTVLSMLASIAHEHPKISRLKEIISRQLESVPGSRIMVFTQFRDTAEIVLKELSYMPGVKVVKLIGQGTRGEERGLRQSEQKEVVSRFSSGDANVMISTSVGEEGLDITSTDMVIFYEPVPSEIRLIQRKGRTGRLRAGRVNILVTRGTKDESFYYSSKRKERMMKMALMSLNEKLAGRSAGLPETETKQKTIFEF